MKLINSSVLMPQNSNYIDNLTIFKFGSLGGGCLVKLVAAKIIRPHMFFFTKSYFMCNYLSNKKRYGILVHENHDKRLKVTAVHHFCRGFDY